MKRLFGMCTVVLCALVSQRSFAQADDDDVYAADSAEDEAADPASQVPTPVEDGGGTAPDEARGLEQGPGVESEDVALFLPRAVLFVPGLVVRLVYFPIRHGLRFIERHAIIEHVEDVLYNDERTAGVVPVLGLSSYFGVFGGARAFHDDLGGHGERGAIEARFGGSHEQAYEISFEAEDIGRGPLYVRSFTRFERAPQQLFQGFGHPAEALDGAGLSPGAAAVETFYEHQRFMQKVALGLGASSESGRFQLGGFGKFTRHDFAPADGLSTGDLSLEQVYDIDQVQSFNDGATVSELAGTLTIDTRDFEGATSSGIYFEAFGGPAFVADGDPYIHYGTEFTAYINLYRKTRVLVLRAVVESIEDDGTNIPFVELPSLGGPRRLRGYPLDRFRDQKAYVGTVEYHYPIHQYVAGALYLDAGQVAGDYKDWFSDPSVQLGGGGGFIIRSKNSTILTVDVAYGESLQLHVTTDPLRAFGDEDEQL